MHRSIAYLITAHGFGHATREAAVMSALVARDPTIHFEIFSEVPAWVFEDSLDSRCSYHDVATDVGLVQAGPFEVNLAATLRRLDDFLPFPSGTVNRLAQQVRRLGCEMVLCDVSALGIAVARAARLPSVLIENFTWDWIYTGYLSREPHFATYIEEIQKINRQVDYRIQTEPLCDPLPEAALTAPPISRRPKNDRAVVRSRLGIPPDSSVVLITTGGIQGTFPFLDRLAMATEAYFILPGAADRLERRGNIVVMPHHSDFYHPDLTHASDTVIGKAGYSTIAEAYTAGLPLGYVTRSGFRESPVLEEFINREMLGFAISEDSYATGDWIERVPELLKLPKIKRSTPNGADVVADFILQIR